MADPFYAYPSGINGPASSVYDITPDDNTDLATTVRGLTCLASGNVAVTTVNDTSATIYVIAGQVFPIRVKRVLATGTTATGIVGIN